MKTYARIENNTVVEIIEPFLDLDGNEVPIENRFHPTIVATMVEIPPSGVEIGDLYENGVFSKPGLPPAPSLDALKASALLELNAESQRVASGLMSDYPEFEKLTWEDQRRDAMAWKADNAAATPYIDVLAQVRGIDRVDYLNRTLAKINAFSAAAQQLVGQRQKYEDQIKAAATQEALDAIKPVFSLA